jgi:hypothetical protein
MQAMIISFREIGKIFALATLCAAFAPGPADYAEVPRDVEADVRIEIAIANREIVGNRVIRVRQGQIVKMVWTTDEETDVHIHGYEIHIEASPESAVEVIFEAQQTGRFPVTSHGFAEKAGKMHKMLVYVEVQPD